MNEVKPVFHTYEEVEAAIMDKVQERIVRGRFMTGLLNGDYTEGQIREFALQYSYYSRSFPRVLGAAVAAMEPIDKWWVPIVDNLWDEAGRGNPKAYHSKLYRTFLETAAPDIFISEEHIPDYPVAPPAKRAVETFIRFLQNATPIEAMAAIGLGSEFFASDVMGLIGKGLQHPNYNKNRKLQVAFWTVHADTHEPRHYQLCKDILAEYEKPEDLTRIYQAGVYIAMSEADLYDGIYERMMAVKGE